MSLVLKMVVSSVSRAADQDGAIQSEDIQLSAVYGPEGSPNAQWAKWTPSGNLRFQVNNPAAFGKVLPGQFYFVQLVPTEKEAS